MHGLQTMKYLNEQASAKEILAKQDSKDLNKINPQFEKAVQEALAARAKNITE